MSRPQAFVLVAVALGLAAVGAAQAGSGSPAPIAATEGAAFDDAVATYTSTVTANQRFVAQIYLDLLGRSVDSSGLAQYTANSLPVIRAIRSFSKWRAGPSTESPWSPRCTRLTCTASPTSRA
jgi:hypothetical protein